MSTNPAQRARTGPWKISIVYTNTFILWSIIGGNFKREGINRCVSRSPYNDQSSRLGFISSIVLTVGKSLSSFNGHHSSNIPTSSLSSPLPQESWPLQTFYANSTWVDIPRSHRRLSLSSALLTSLTVFTCVRFRATWSPPNAPSQPLPQWVQGKCSEPLAIRCKSMLL